MGDQRKNLNLPLLKPGENTPIEFDEDRYFEYLHKCTYKPRQIKKLRLGLKHLRSIFSIEKLIPHLAYKRHLQKLGEELRRLFSSDSAKNALTCARRIRDFALVEGLIKEGLNLRTGGQFAKIEEHFKRCLEVERKFSPEYAKISLKEYFLLSEFLIVSGKQNFDGVTDPSVRRTLGALKMRSTKDYLLSFWGRALKNINFIFSMRIIKTYR